MQREVSMKKNEEEATNVEGVMKQWPDNHEVDGLFDDQCHLLDEENADDIMTDLETELLNEDQAELICEEIEENDHDKVVEAYIGCENVKNSNFFRHNLNNMGNAYLVSKSQFHCGSICSELDESEACLNMCIAEFCLKTNKEMAYSLYDVLDGMLSIYSLSRDVKDSK
eukprot:15334233-Ditylum_brightwellii.AAC.1